MNKTAQILNLGPLNGFGPLGNPEGNGIGNLASVLSIVVGFLSVTASIFFLYKIITGGLSIISAGGDKGKVAAARQSITNGAIGLMIVLFSTVIVGFLGTIVGIDFLNLEGLVNQLTG